MGTRAAGECFHSFFEFSQTFTSVSVTRYKHEKNDFDFTTQSDTTQLKLSSVLRFSLFSLGYLAILLARTRGLGPVSGGNYG